MKPQRHVVETRMKQTHPLYGSLFYKRFRVWHKIGAYDRLADAQRALACFCARNPHDEYRLKPRQTAS